ncbi:uncharacterized protein LOC113852048 [Abrus precatorius]|uniref:Uncharacterized protein LOC113852048 n=1 Tax=Abrus precatorius TaxID=3816 RepID=A0A8B8K2V2_ABRPR|nr:uncharacterized protein LOC113852048 [Abrus precatorius]
MAETQSLPIIEEEREIDEDFYEKIEAPKFVDFTAPDNRRPDDDRHWFCFRVGCDQNHEQDLDSEAIYKNFVLRVMAARSPNVRLRKVFNTREASANLKCPRTAPAKSKSRVSRLALVSSLSQHKITDNSVKVAKPLSKVAATPNAKVKQAPSVAKALTTPRNQKKVSNIEQFRSVQGKKPTAVVVPKGRVVAKALVFHSPKKLVKTKSSVELKTPMRALCSAMKKLELNGAKKNGEGGNSSLSVAGSRKQFKGREVKSRVFDSLCSTNRKGSETNTVRCLKETKVKGMLKRQANVAHENESSDMEIDEKSRSGSLERCHESGNSGSVSELSLGAEKSQEPISGKSSVLILSEAPRGGITSLSMSSSNEENKTTEGNEIEERRNSVSDKGKVPEAKKRKAEENSMASDDKENHRQLNENDDKENASASDENIVMSTNNEDRKKAIIGSKHEDSRKIHKKSSLISAASHAVKYRKLKPTNPKPFKLRTDERGILKEANLDKGIPSPLKETTVRKHQAVNRKKSETCSAQSEQDTDNYSSCDEKSNQAQENQSGSIQSDKTNCKVLRKLSATTPQRNPGTKLQKPIELDDNCKRKSQMMQRKVVRPRNALSRKKEKVVVATKLSVIIEKPLDIVKKPKEAAKPRKNDVASLTSKTTGSTSRFYSRERRPLTVPKEPKFQCLHVPKGCTTRKQT